MFTEIYIYIQARKDARLLAGHLPQFQQFRGTSLITAPLP